MAQLVFIFLEINLADAAQIIGVMSSLIVALSVVAGVVWFVFKGKSLEACKEDLARSEKREKELREEASDAKTKKLEALEEKARALAELNDIKRTLKETEGRLQRSLEREEDKEKENFRLIGEVERMQRELRR